MDFEWEISGMFLSKHFAFMPCDTHHRRAIEYRFNHGMPFELRGGGGNHTLDSGGQNNCQKPY